MTSDEMPSPPAPMMTIGLELRQAREARGISLRELSERTKIRQPALRAIESDDLRQLPGGAIGRGFVKLYAREVGLDAHAMAERFDAQRESDAGDLGGEPGASGETALANVWFLVTHARRAMVLAAIVVLAVGYFVVRPGPPSPPAAEERPVTAAPSTPVGVPSVPGSTAPAVPAGTAPVEAAQVPAGTVRVEVHATGDCWIAATADGQQVVYRVLPAGERATMSATTEAVVRIGMPANVNVTINGRPLRPFERPGSPITLRITPANYRDLIQA